MISLSVEKILTPDESSRTAVVGEGGDPPVRAVRGHPDLALEICAEAGGPARGLYGGRQIVEAQTQLE